MRYPRTAALLATTAFTALTGAAAAQSDSQANVFTLGTIYVYADKLTDQPGTTTSTLSAEDMHVFDRKRLDDALNLVPGTTSVSTGGESGSVGSRNEGVIYVRGYNRLQVPLSIDGIQVYLPADNRLDFSRFLTVDVAEVQVAKGYVSVLNGPGALGAAINLVTRKPTEEFEARAGGSLDMDSRLQGTGYSMYGMVGTKQGNWYAQFAGSTVDKDGWPLSQSFTPTANENGGLRDHSDTKDYRFNVKAGYTPNETDEYTIAFTRQAGTKGAPFHVNATTNPLTGASNSRQRDWTWPNWDINSAYFLSTTKLTDSTTLKSKVYYNTFYNTLYSYDDATFTTQTLQRAFRSYYDDVAYGASVELGQDFGTLDTLKGSAYYRRDKHTEWQVDYGPYTLEPDQHDIEDTYSFALENTFHATDAVDVLAGVSYDGRHLLEANDWTRTVVSGVVTSSGFVNYNLGNGHAVNWQGAVSYRIPDFGTVHASVSHRTRFPTIFERFSSRFGGATSNPYLKPEKATSYEVGYQGNVYGVKLESALFYNRLTDVIESVNVTFPSPIGASTQSQNVGSGRTYGIEVGASRQIFDSLLIGGNATYMDRKVVDPNNPAFFATGVPRLQGFLYATYKPSERWSFTPSVELASKRYTQASTSLSSPPTGATRYYTTGSYTLVNMRVAFQMTPSVEFALSGRNLLDENYQLTDGFPSPGRTLSLSTDFTF